MSSPGTSSVTGTTWRKLEPIEFFNSYGYCIAAHKDAHSTANSRTPYTIGKLTVCAITPFYCSLNNEHNLCTRKPQMNGMLISPTFSVPKMAAQFLSLTRVMYVLSSSTALLAMTSIFIISADNLKHFIYCIIHLANVAGHVAMLRDPCCLW